VSKLHTHEVVGKPTEVILRLVKELNVMNLVVGRRGMSVEKRQELGSTSASLVSVADCNVVVVKQSPN
jgi:nucleotide-binding universal stress UspA family protein